MNKLSTGILLVIILSSIFGNPFFSPDVRAQGGPVIPNPNSLGGSIKSVFDSIVKDDSGLAKEDNIFVTIASVIRWLLALSAMLGMGAIVWGGIMYILSLGNESKAEHAKQIILYAVIGVIFVLLSYVIIAFIQGRLSGTTTYIPSAVTVAYAANEEITTDFGFRSGLGAIRSLIKPKESGLVEDPDIFPVILRVINFLLSLVAVLALGAMVWGALMYILSLGDEGKVEKAKNIVIYAVIGVLLAGVSFLILNVVRTFLTG